MQNIYEVTVVSGNAESVLLIAANSISEARQSAYDRIVSEKDVCWEGVPDEDFEILYIVDMGPDFFQVKILTGEAAGCGRNSYKVPLGGFNSPSPD